jgi:nickel-dependent lactate racemase
MIGHGSTTQILQASQVQQLLAQAFDPIPLDGKRVLVIIPDSTRTAPMPLMFKALHAQLGERVKQLDFLIALGTHQPMNEEAIAKLVGVGEAERKQKYSNTHIYNHAWDNPSQLVTLGTVARAEMDKLSGGLYADDVPVRLNKMILDYDHLVIVGPVFPHEVVGFSGGAKYLFPGIAGSEIINFTHWVAALVSNVKTIGVKDTPVRRIIHRVAEYVTKPITCCSMVMNGSDYHGLYIGSYQESWSAAADLSAQLNIVYKPRAFKRVLSMPSEMYDELWTGGKAMYKTEPVIADGGELVIYAPHIKDVSVTHGKLIEQVGYHVMEYFSKQQEQFQNVPGTIKAHSTHVKGAGKYDAVTGIETPRVNVILATGISEEKCKQINLGYADYRTINPQEWENREEEGILVVHHAGEVLYRVK